MNRRGLDSVWIWFLPFGIRFGMYCLPSWNWFGIQFPLTEIRARNLDLDSVLIRFGLWSSRFDSIVILIPHDLVQLVEFEN